MKSQHPNSEEISYCAPEARHCSVCFAVIEDIETARRSPEGHIYCEHCSAGFFRKVQLALLRKNCCSLVDRKALA